MIIIFIRTAAIFLTLMAVMRLMGKRQIGEMQPFEFVITLIVADLACIPMADVSIPLVYGIVAILTLFLLHQLIFLLENCGAFFLPVKFFTLLFGEETLARGFVYGLVECTTGVGFAANSLSPLKIPAVGFLISFGGLSVMAQSLVFLKKAKIKTARFFLSKFLHAAFTFLILFSLSFLTPL